MTENQIQGMATGAAREYYDISGRCTCDSYFTTLQVIIERTLRAVIDSTKQEMQNGTLDLLSPGAEGSNIPG